ncbi:hypothetical protein ACJIZ3_023440 [Penstemon smallii]|uniref:Secreted protein n=1 Tax=Penstemon smallii TaxID=265156 RepID=A0ABD3TP39_9LAMI
MRSASKILLILIFYFLFFFYFQKHIFSSTKVATKVRAYSPYISPYKLPILSLSLAFYIKDHRRNCDDGGGWSSLLFSKD